MAWILAVMLFVALVAIACFANREKYWRRLAEANERDAGVWRSAADERLRALNIAQASANKLHSRLDANRDAVGKANADRDEANKRAKDLEYAQHQLKVIRDYLLGTQVYSDQAGSVDMLEPGSGD